MTLDIQLPLLSKTNLLIRKICRIIFLTSIGCSIPLIMIDIIQSLELLLSFNPSDPRCYVPIFVLFGIAFGVFLNFYIYKKVYKQYGYWLLVIIMAFTLYGWWLVTPFFHTIDLYYKMKLSFLERFHFNSYVISTISGIMQVISYLLTVSYFFMISLNVKYHIENRKIKKSLNLKESD